MKRSLRKITYREIRRSFGRFLSILCIVLLGAGFLYGLRVTEGDMIRTLDQYADENKFFDYKIVSTLGLTADDVADFALSLYDAPGAPTNWVVAVVLQSQVGSQAFSNRIVPRNIQP